jgi:hypothetical protein
MKEYEHIMLALIALGVVVYFGNKIHKKIKKKK